MNSARELAMRVDIVIVIAGHLAYDIDASDQKNLDLPADATLKAANLRHISKIALFRTNPPS